MTKALILYYSRDGHTRRMANQIARGVAAIDGCESIVRTVPELATVDDSSGASTHTNTLNHHPSAESISGYSPYITKEELAAADALIVGSPTRFGNMAAPLKHFFDSTSDLWISGVMCNKPAAVFTSSSSMHGGQESTLFTMMLPLIHHGMLIVGIPYTEAALEQTSSGGTPYGASNVSGQENNAVMTTEEKTLCLALGRRVATIASKLSN